jgi:hypothetical protein
LGRLPGEVGQEAFFKVGPLGSAELLNRLLLGSLLADRLIMGISLGLLRTQLEILARQRSTGLWVDNSGFLWKPLL